ncbi:zf-HC2 domain-containing protein [Amycolatopsis azurea]|uniref:zf-HC2 domain-containing protein n=1 Tax=Amycolatopsis azurea TaxID=36819 RepID=UPI00382E25A8
MKCAEFRESFSSRLDGETDELTNAALETHLRSCTYCRTWRHRVSDLRQLMLVRSAPEVPDLTDRILRVLPAAPGERWALRVALAMVALSQSGLGFAQLIMPGGGHSGHPGATGAPHLGNESAAWNLAVGIGLLWAALRPRTAAGLLPALTGFVVVLGTVSAIDLANGQVTPDRVLSHAFVVAGVGLLFAIRRQARRPPGPLLDARGSEDDYVEFPEPPEVPGPRPALRGLPRLPTGRHRAA